MSTEREFKEKLKKMEEIFIKKNKDYGDHFTSYTKESAYLDLLRKWKRIETVFKNGKVSVDSETIQDTLIDLANYSILTAILLEKDGKNNKKRTKEEI